MIARIFLTILLLSSVSLAMGELPDGNLELPQSSIQKLDFALPDLQGNRVSPDDFSGKVVLVNFWASWCPPCREEMPSMQKLYSRLKNQRFEMLAVSLDRGGAPAVIRFLADKKYAFKVLMDENGRVASRYGISSIPTTFIIDKKGAVKYQIIGGRNWMDPKIVLEIQKLIEK